VYRADNSFAVVCVKPCCVGKMFNGELRHIVEFENPTIARFCLGGFSMRPAIRCGGQMSREVSGSSE
jgi:hypothetical protein